jgi:hypothetical protein
MVRTDQGGSILSFVIVGAVLASLLVSGAFIVNRQAYQPHDVASSPAPVTNTSSKTTKNTPPTSGAEQAPPVTSPPEKTKVAPTNKPVQPASSPAAQLPHTGPVQTFAGSIGLGCLTYIITAYIQSRQLRGSPLTSLL